MSEISTVLLVSTLGIFAIAIVAIVAICFGLPLKLKHKDLLLKVGGSESNDKERDSN